MQDPEKPNRNNPISEPPAAQSLLAGEAAINEASPNGLPKLAAGIYFVATPIGNLRDITLRALDVLRVADVIVCEDTRQSQKLLSAYDISARLSPYHDHNAAQRIPGLLNLLSEGKSIAVMSDAGTPLVSDPGYKLAREAIAAGYDVIPIPGASAVLAGLQTSGLPSDRFMFAGFLPPKSQARQTALAELAGVPATLIFFETGNRLLKSLSDILDVLGDRDMAIARELTKKFEQTRRGAVSDLIEGIKADPPRGEIVLIIGPSVSDGLWDQARVDAALLERIESDGVKRAANAVAALSGHNRREVYARALFLKDERSD